MGSIEDLNIEVTLYNRDLKVFRTVVNALIPDLYTRLEAFFLDDHDTQPFYTTMEIKYGGQVIMSRDVKSRGMSIHG